MMNWSDVTQPALWLSSGKPLLLTGLAVLLTMTACANVDDAINLRKLPPDEFQVVFRPPLTLPPDFSLRPIPGEGGNNGNQAGGAETIDVSAQGLTDQLLTDKKRADASAFDDLFGTDRIVPGIRERIDSETLGVQLEQRVPAELLFGGVPDIGPALDANAEAIRIRQAIKDGKPLTETPTIGRSLQDDTQFILE